MKHVWCFCARVCSSVGTRKASVVGLIEIMMIMLDLLCLFVSNSYEYFRLFAEVLVYEGTTVLVLL